MLRCIKAKTKQKPPHQCRTGVWKKQVIGTEGSSRTQMKYPQTHSSFCSKFKRYWYRNSTINQWKMPGEKIILHSITVPSHTRPEGLKGYQVYFCTSCLWSTGSGMGWDQGLMGTSVGEAYREMFLCPLPITSRNSELGCLELHSRIFIFYQTLMWF